MSSGLWKLIFVLCVMGAFGFIASYSYAKVVDREWSGNSVAMKALPVHREAKPVELVRQLPELKSRRRFELPFACEDTDKACLTLLAEKDHPRQLKNNKVSDVDHSPARSKRHG